MVEYWWGNITTILDKLMQKKFGLKNCTKHVGYEVRFIQVAWEVLKKFRINYALGPPNLDWDFYESLNFKKLKFGPQFFLNCFNMDLPLDSSRSLTRSPCWLLALTCDYVAESAWISDYMTNWWWHSIWMMEWHIR